MDDLFRRTLLFLGFLGLLNGQRLLAQNDVVLRISAFTSAERDALTAGLHDSGGPEVVFACVPAGILVVRTPLEGASREEARTRMRSALTKVVPAARITEEPLTLEAAEEQCANARNR